MSAAKQPVWPEYQSGGPAMMQVYMHMLTMSHRQQRLGWLLPYWNSILEADCAVHVFHTLKALCA